MNVEYYAILSKLNPMAHQIDSILVGKAEMMRTEIKDKIKHFSSHVDLMYQLFDRKIAILIGEIDSFGEKSEQIQQQHKAH
jgi:hypothetical protein